MPAFRALQCGRYVLDLTLPAIVGIVNLTDDSFSGDGVSKSIDAAILRALEQIEDGAHILDIGAESSRPGATPVSASQEIERLIPVLNALKDCGVPISVDTTKVSVMKAALNAGADMINDIGALRAPGALELLASTKSAIVLMHMHGDPSTMQNAPSYVDVVNDVKRFLAKRVKAVVNAGINLERVIVDPGIGFGKSLEHNVAILRHIAEFSEFDVPVMVGVSRKSFLGSLTGQIVGQRVYAGIAANLFALQRGAKFVRVHDVRATRDALEVMNALARV